jgi:RNA-directed DNA polymerase
VVNADLDAYFNTIDHDVLFAKVTAIITDPEILNLLKLWVKAEVYDGDKVFVMERGLPQGAVISLLLANLFLDQLDETLSA